MARDCRSSSCSCIYHVMLRGNEKKQIFRDDKDRQKFIEILFRAKNCNSIIFYSFCLMENHVHLLLRESNDNISTAIKRIGVSYAYYFNQKYKRVGHLFQDRFRSEVVEDDSYILTLVRYIHCNPIKAGIANRIEDYDWSSYREYICKDEDIVTLANTSFLLGMYSNNRDISIDKFIKHHQEQCDNNLVILDECNDRIIFNEQDIQIEINKILLKNKINTDYFMVCKDKKERDYFIREIKEETGFSIRQLSKILGVSKDIISRA